MSAAVTATSEDFQAEIHALANATKIVASESHKLAQLAVSFHNQMLTFNQADGYIILQLSDEQRTDLKNKGFSFASAHDWVSQRTAQLKALQRAQSQKLNISSTDTIDGLSCYSTVEGTFARAESMVVAHPSFTRWVDIGDSWAKTQDEQAGYDIKVLQITNQQTDDVVADKPILFIHSAMHSRELATAELTTRFAEYLLDNRDTDADIRWILDEHQVHIVFHMNPDGRKKAEAGLFWRKNVNTSQCANDSSAYGVDLNRNFSHFWNTTTNGSSGNQCSDVYRGPTAGSEPETQAIENYIRSIYADNRGPLDSDAAPEDTHGMHIDVHSHGGMVLWPWGHRSDVAPNGVAMQTLGRKMAYYNDYWPMQGVGLYPTDGTSDDGQWGAISAMDFTVVEEGEEPINQAPQAAFSVNCTGLICAMDGSQSSDSDGSIVQYTWQLGDGNEPVSTDVATLEHRYLPGDYTLELTVTDNQQAQSSISQALSVSNLPPSAVLTVNCNEGQCQFDGSSSSDDDGNVESYLWQVADQALTATSATTSHTFSESGTYTVSLTVSDDIGDSDTESLDVTVTVTNEQPVPLPIPDNNSSGGGGSMAWWSVLGLLICRFRSKGVKYRR